MYGNVPVTPQQQACAAVGIPNPDLIRIPARTNSRNALSAAHTQTPQLPVQLPTHDHNGYIDMRSALHQKTRALQTRC
jgi:hypothetical protein